MDFFTIPEYVELRDFCQSQIDNECRRLYNLINKEIKIDQLSVKTEPNTIIITNSAHIIKIYYKYIEEEYEEGEIVNVYPFIATYNTVCNCHPTVRYYARIENLLEDLKKSCMLPVIETTFEGVNYVIGPDIIHQKLNYMRQLAKLKK